MGINSLEFKFYIHAQKATNYKQFAVKIVDIKNELIKDKSRRSSSQTSSTFLLAL